MYAPFKHLIDDLATSNYVGENLDDDVHGNFSAKQSRMLLATWIGKAWEKTFGNRHMVVRGFRKCGISLAIDGSKDDINIKGIENYQVDSGDDDSFESEGDSFENDLSESDTAPSTDDDVDVQITGVEVVSDGENFIIDLS